MTNKSELGKFGEDVACEYLRDLGYQVLERNVRRTYGELDIVAKDSAGVLAFVEVKTMYASEFLKPEDNLTSAKLKKFQRIASLFAGAHANLIRDDRGWRVDLLAISIPNEYGTPTPHELTRKEKDVLYKSISFYQNIC